MELDPKTMRTTKPGLKPLILTLIVPFSFILCFPLLWKSVEIYRSPLPFRGIEAFSSQLDSEPLHFRCQFQAMFLGFNFTASNDVAEAIINKMSLLNPNSLQCGNCGAYEVSVVIDSGSSCVRTQNSKAQCPFKCGEEVAFFGGKLSDEDVDDLLRGCLGNVDGGGNVYSVVVVNGGDKEAEVRAVVGKYRHAWILGRVLEEEALSRVAEIFAKVFMNGRSEGDLIRAEFMPVGADGRIVLSFSLLNAEPRDWIYDWNFREIDETLLQPVIQSLQPIANITVESQVLYHTQMSSFSYWDEVNSNEWHLDTSVAAGGRSKLLQLVVYIPSAKECPLRLELPNGDLSNTNGFISPDIQKLFGILMGQLRQLLGLKSDNLYVDQSGTYVLQGSEKGFTQWELDILSRNHVCFNLYSCAATLGSLSRLVQSLPRMIITDEIGKKVMISLEAAKFAQSNASAGIYDASAASSRQARSLAEDSFFHPSIMSISYYSYWHSFIIYTPYFLLVMKPVIFPVLSEWKRYKQENMKFVAWKAKAK
ncbi:uncharacterized protein [Arachis hypogaea]|uniref:uncharacterized protein isoform X8 n=1 Tax=Arachis hypogaea TaxID=3818 RepID=UPI0034E62D62